MPTAGGGRSASHAGASRSGANQGSRRAANKATSCFKAPNRTLQRLWDDRAMRMHRMKLQSMRPAIDNKQPAKYQHLVHNMKRMQVEEERLTEIERQNTILLGKLSKIAARRGVEGSEFKDLGPKSLNAVSRKQALQRIASENHEILRRITNVQNSHKSEYSVKALEKEWRQNQQYRKLISTHPESFPSLRARAVKDELPPLPAIALDIDIPNYPPAAQ